MLDRPSLPDDADDADGADDPRAGERPAAADPRTRRGVAGHGDVLRDDPVVALDALATSYHTLMRQALTTVRRALDDGGVPGATGLGPAALLELEHRLPRALVRQLETVASRLPWLPDTAEVFAAGIIEFADLALVVSATRDLGGAGLAELDRWAADRACHLADRGLLHLLDGDVLARVEQLRAPGWARRQEQRAERGRTLSMQQDLDGGGLVWASLDAVGFSTVGTGIEAIAGPPSPSTTRRRQRADALVAMAEHALAGTGTGPAGTDRTPAPTPEGTTPAAQPARSPGAPSDDDGPPHAAAGATGATATVVRPTPGETRVPARPRARITLVIDLAQATEDRFALLQRTTGLRAAPTLSARLTDTLAANAQLFIQLADGRRPLAELAADDIPEAVRRAVASRDRGCRAPGCARPVHECDVHHIHERHRGGGHDPDNLLLLCRRHHTALERHRWRVSLDPVTATATWVHGGASPPRRTVPHGTRPPPPHPDDVPLAEWQAPPIPPPPPDRWAPPAD